MNEAQASQVRNLTVEDVALRYNCSRAHIDRLVADGELNSGNIARKGARRKVLRFSETDLVAYDRKCSTLPDSSKSTTGQASEHKKQSRRQPASRRFNYLTQTWE
jgi:hypothetical protein